MMAQKFYSKVAARTGIRREVVRDVMNGVLAEMEHRLMQGDEVRLRGVCRLFIKFSNKKFRLQMRTMPAFAKRVDSDFVENREVAV